MTRKCITACLLISAVAMCRAQSSLAPAYTLERAVRLGGAGGWDYFDVDPSTHRIFIPRGSHMMVCDEDGSIVVDMQGLSGAHAVALAPDLERGFTANDTGHSVTIFSLKTFAKFAEVSLGEKTPDGILYDPFTRQVFTFNGDSDHSATVIDALTGKVVDEIPLGGKPETAQSDEAGNIYVNIQNQDKILTLDATSGKALSTWPTAPCKEPAGMAIDRKNHQLFVGCRNEQMTLVDYATGKTLASVGIGWLVDANRYDPGTRLVFASAGDGTITIARRGSSHSLEVVQTLITRPWARTIALDPMSHKLFAVTADVKPGPYPPSASHPQRQGEAIPGTFTLLIYKPAN